MFKISSFLALIAGFLVLAESVNAQSMYKCKANGTITYQQDPCPYGQVRKLPAVQDLNAAEKKRREAVAIATPETSAAVKEKSTINPQRPEKLTPTTSSSPTASASSGSFSCDGRKHCSQMKSCAEAKYFLANCPGVKMDGDNDGIPCEEQWCSQ